MKAKYINPFTDFGFKKIFGEEADVFSQAFEKAELAKFGQEELDRYENSLKIYRDLKGVINSAFDEGKIEGKIEVAEELKKNGVSIAIIAKSTGLSEMEIEKL